MRYLLVLTITLLCSFQALASKISDPYERALSHIEENNLAAAEIELKNSIRDNSNYLPARLKLGEVLLEMGNLKAAEKELTRALALNADTSQVILLLVKVKSGLSKYQEVEELLISHPEIKSEPHYYLYLGRAKKAQLQYKQANDFYLLELQNQGTSAELLTAFADIVYLENQLDVALIKVNEALALDANFMSALLLKAEILKRSHQKTAALENYQTVLKQDNENEKALLGIALILVEQNKLDEALNTLKQLIKVNENNPYAKLLQANILTQQGKERESKNVLRGIRHQLSTIPEENSKDKAVLYLHANLNFMLNDHQKAYRQYIEYIELYGEDLAARKYLAQMAVKNNNLDTAESHINIALANYPNDEDIHLLAAHIYKAQKKYPIYVDFVANAYTKFPQNQHIRNLYVGSLLASGQEDKAQQTLKNNSEDSELATQTTLGYLQLQNGQIAEATKTVDALLANHPHKIEILQLAGELAIKTGQQDQAIKVFSYILELDAKFPPAALALAGIALNNNDVAEAQKHYKQLLSINPKDLTVLKLFADLAIKHQAYELALNLLLSIEGDDKNKLLNQRAILDLALKTNQLTIAKQSITNIEAENWLDHTYLLLKSQYQQKTNNITEAQKTLRSVFGLAYDQPQKLKRLVLLQIALNDITAADKTIKRIKDLKQNVNRYTYARLALAKDRPQDGLNLINEELKKQPKAAQWQEMQIHALLQLGKDHKAISALEKLYQQEPKRQHMQLLAQLYVQAENDHALTAMLQNWIKQNPADAWAVSQLAMLAEKNNQIELAIDTLENYPHINQQSLFLNNLANLYLKKDPNTALDYANKAHAISPNISEINDTLGWVLVTLGQYEKGLGYLREANARDTNKAEYYYHLAFTLAKLKRKKSAQNSLNKAKQLRPEHSLSLDIEKLIKQIN